MQHRVDTTDRPIAVNGSYRFLDATAFGALCGTWGLDPERTSMLVAGPDVIIRHQGDLSDLGNELGLVIGHRIDDTRIGYAADDLFAGIKHGLSLVARRCTEAAYEPSCQQPPQPMSDNTAPVEHDDFSWFHPGPLLHANGSPAFDRATLSFHHDNGTLAYSYATRVFHHHNGQPAFDTRTRILHHNNGSQAFVMPEDHRGSFACEGHCPDGSPLLYWAKRVRIQLGSSFRLEVGWYDDLCDCITLHFGDTKVAELGDHMRM